jgi:hypothetical protein
MHLFYIFLRSLINCDKQINTEKENFLRLLLQIEIIIIPALSLYSCNNRPARVIAITALMNYVSVGLLVNKRFRPGQVRGMSSRKFKISLHDFVVL